MTGYYKSTAALKYQLRANMGVKYRDIRTAPTGHVFKTKEMSWMCV